MTACARALPNGLSAFFMTGMRHEPGVTASKGTVSPGSDRTAARARRVSPRPSAATRRTASRSRTVGVLKVLFPLVAFFMIALVVAWPYLSVEQGGFRLGFAIVDSPDGGDPSIVNARFHSTDDKANPYAITADFARNLTRDTERVDLEMPKADVALDDGTWLVLTASTGNLFRVEKELALAGQVNLFHDSGYEFNTEKAHVDLSAGIASGDVAVSGHGPFGTLEAEGFRILNDKKIIQFIGKSRVTLYPGPDQGWN